MKHSIPFALRALLIVLAFTLTPQKADAEVTRRNVPKGAVTGLEMSIEGSMSVAPGGRLRWFVTVHEILNGRDFRPAKGVELKAQTSFHRQAPVAVARTDARGRAAVEFTVPPTVTSSFHLVVEARSSKGVKRDFDVSVALLPRYATELFLGRQEVPPGGEVRAWGRVVELATMKPVAGHEVALHAQANGQLVGSRRSLTTNQQGLFQAALQAPRDAGSFSVVAQAEDASQVTQNASAKAKAIPALVVRAQPVPLVAKPGSTIMVDVSVRRPDGRPVGRAALSGLSIPKTIKTASGKRKKAPPVLTDEKGVAQVPWKVGPQKKLSEALGVVAAVREGIGTGAGDVTVRVAADDALISWAIEGGAFVPGLSNRLVVRALNPDGSPKTNVRLSIAGGRLSSAKAKTDADGAAVLETTIASLDPNPPPSCQGPTLASAVLKVGSHSQSLCLPVDPDATLRVRAPTRVRSGTSFDVELLANANVARMPIAVTAFGRDKDNGWVALAQSVVNAGLRRTKLLLPPEARGAVWVRARPLLGSVLQPVRGGTTMIWAEVGRDATLQLTPSATGKMQLSSRDRGSVFAFALPSEEGKQLLDVLRRRRGSRPNASAGEAEWLGFLASQTPMDRAVSSVLRNGKAVPLAMPEDPVELGLLRDPWRTRSRFVRGRLGRLMLAVETHVHESLPDALHNVAVRGPRGWRFNSEILTILANELGIEAVAGLAGNPLGIADLQKLDPEFVFDNVARRLTRERILRALVGLRQFVKAEQLDYSWARRGDPSAWLSALLTWDDPDGEFMIEAEELYDGWGTPLKIRKAKGGRARFRFLEPIVGYEVVSAGPDGRFGTRDDFYDPFSRVLSRQSLYGEAVGEQALLARLQGVELGRATIAALSEVFEVFPPEWATSEMRASGRSWKRPRKLEREEGELMAQVTGVSPQSPSAFGAFEDGMAQLQIDLSSEPRRYTVIGGIYTSDGRFSFERATLSAGAPILVDASMPKRLRPDETLEIPVLVVGLAKNQKISVSASGRGAISAKVVGESRITLAQGQSETLRVRLDAKGVGGGTVTVRIANATGATQRVFQAPVSVMWDGSFRAQHRGVLAKGRAKLALNIPTGVKPVRSTLVVTSPRALLRDPGFKRVERRYPELLAWAHGMQGEAIPGALVETLSKRRQSARSMIGLLSACSAVAWSQMEETPENQHRRSSAITILRGLSAPSSLRERSALLVALASVASPIGEATSSDPVAALVARLREDGWHAPKTERSRPTVMARLAAGLLLADANDMSARRLFDLAVSKLEKGDFGGKILPGENGSDLDGWIGTLALAIAARQLGDEALLGELMKSVAPRFYLGLQPDVEPAFWLLAASGYGVFGMGAPDSVTASIAGEAHSLRLRNGVARFSLPKSNTKIVLKTPMPVLARVEARYVRPVEQMQTSPLRASIRGDVGYTRETAALELVVRNSSDTELARPVVEIILPSAALLDKQARATMASAPGVKRVDKPDRAGVLRVVLSPLDGQEKLRLALPIQWIGVGTVRGLAITAFDANAPWNVSSTKGRSIKLEAAPEETWK